MEVTTPTQTPPDSPDQLSDDGDAWANDPDKIGQDGAPPPVLSAGRPGEFLNRTPYAAPFITSSVTETPTENFLFDPDIQSARRLAEDALAEVERLADAAATVLTPAKPTGVSREASRYANQILQQADVKVRSKCVNRPDY